LALVVISYSNSYLGALTSLALAVALSSVHNRGGLVNPQDIAPRLAGSDFGVMNMAGAIPGFVGVYIADILEATKRWSWSAVFNQTSAVCVAGWSVFALLGTGQKIV
jgi:ACS family sodium-dependent inorganic phosphate cotransporter-like MFS transporter 9